MTLGRLEVMDEIPKFEDNETTFPEIYERIQKTIKLCESTRPEAFEGKETAAIQLKLRGHEVNFTAMNYLQLFALPNCMCAWYRTTKYVR